jgi:hypothetical protein
MVMASNKIDSRLEKEMRAARAAGLGNRHIAVVIDHADGALVSRDPRDGMAHLEKRVRHLQNGIVDQLLEFGAPDIQQSVWANLIGVSLLPQEIEAVAARDDVASVRLNGGEHTHL